MNANRITSPFLYGAATPDAVAVDLPATQVPGSYVPYAGGEVGATFDYGAKTYSVVIVDSGATSANTVGAVAANQLLFWKSKVNRIVTNDARQAIGFSAAAQGNEVAGIARCAVAVPGAGGTLINMLIRGSNITVASGAGPTVGMGLVADTTANVAQVTNTAVGTASPYVQVGVARGSVSNGAVAADINIPQII